MNGLKENVLNARQNLCKFLKINNDITLNRFYNKNKQNMKVKYIIDATVFICSKVAMSYTEPLNIISMTSSPPVFSFILNKLSRNQIMQINPCN